MLEKHSRYAQRGVSFSKKEIHSAIKNLNKGLFPHSFCKVISDEFNNNSDYALIMHSDGAGTKSVLAYMYWKETGDISVFDGIAQDVFVMNIDDILCVSPIKKAIMSSTIGRNAHKISGEVVARLIQANENLIKVFNNFGLDIINTGGETADLGDLIRTIIVDATFMARCERKKIIDFSKLSSKQVIVGFASFGKANYEEEYNSGIGSNGLSSARHEIFHHPYAELYPETYSKEIEKALIYNGKFSLTDRVNDIPLNMGKALLSPTRTYAPILLAIYQEFFNEIAGVIHCTGGGQTKCLKFGEGIEYIKDNFFEIPPIFSYIQESSKTSWEEMYSVFNMGHLLELICPKEIANDIINISKSFGIEAKIIGFINKTNEKNLLTIESSKVKFTIKSK